MADQTQRGASDATVVTTATYETIAADYEARSSDPAVLADIRARFAALLPLGARGVDVSCEDQDFFGCGLASRRSAILGTVILVPPGYARQLR